MTGIVKLGIIYKQGCKLILKYANLFLFVLKNNHLCDKLRKKIIFLILNLKMIILLL